MDRSGDLITKFRFNVQTTSLNEQFSIRLVEIGLEVEAGYRSKERFVKLYLCRTNTVQPFSLHRLCEKVCARFWFRLFISYIYTHLMRK